MKLNIKLLLIITFALASCEKLINVDLPTNQLISSSVYEDEFLAEASVKGIYSVMRLGGISSGSNAGLSLLCGLSSDELIYSSTDEFFEQFYTNSILSTNPKLPNLWNTTYSTIYKCNSVVEGLAKSTKLSDNFAHRLMGEALFLRAFNHFYLASLFGDIPYITSTNYIVNNVVKRQPVLEVMRLAIEDLNAAKEHLSEDYSPFGNSRLRANKYAASALLARIYLNISDWEKAEKESSLIIDNAQYNLQVDLLESFKVNNTEAIWQLDNETNILYTDEGLYFLNQSSGLVTLRNSLVTSFEKDDLRASKWILQQGASFIPYKYQDGSSSTSLNEYRTVFRLAEQYLIRAEARAMQNKLLGMNSASSDINKIRYRAGLPETSATQKQAILDAILNERRHELFVEWGHRWLDLKRLNLATSVLSPIKQAFNATDTFYPIPDSEIILNKNLRQNDGY